MRYMLIIKATKDYEAGALPDESTLMEMAKFTEELVAAGAWLGAERLQPSSAGLRAHSANGKITMTDGPFPETKELIAGFCLIRAESRDAAIAWAKRIPLQAGEIEVRPLFEVADFPADPSEQSDGWRESEEHFRAVPPPRTPGTVRYIGLVKADQQTEAGGLPDEKALAAMGAFMEKGVKSGVFLSGDGLKPSSMGARIRFSKGQPTVTDGPFPETKELVGGYAILQFTSRAQAIEWTRRFVEVDAPFRLNGESTCELRPLFDYENFGPSEALERFRNLGKGTQTSASSTSAS